MPQVKYTQTKGLHQVSATGSRVLLGDGDSPAVTFAAGAGTISGNDVCGIVTVATQGTSGNAITITFSKAYAVKPVVTLNYYDLANVADSGVTVSKTAITITPTGNTGTGEIHYQVFGISN
ncbi:MAG TPA: hypothetical protein DD671_10010 [Balneolaceae bacterium]|nr:hypothetical protein [Balneolaceae bacterium]